MQVAAGGENVTALGAGALKAQTSRYHRLPSNETFWCMKILTVVCLLCFGKLYVNRMPRSA